MRGKPEVEVWMEGQQMPVGACALGIDLVETERVQRALEEHGVSWLKRVLTQEEQGLCSPLSSDRKVEWIAGRLAAKEAIFKALASERVGGMRWQEIEILVQPSGAPLPALHGELLELWQNRGAPALHLSLTHDGGWAWACCQLVGDAMPQKDEGRGAVLEGLDSPIQNNLGRHLAVEGLETCPAFLSPTGIRYMAQRLERSAAVCVCVERGQVQDLAGQVDELRMLAHRQGWLCPNVERWECLIGRLQAQEPRLEAVVRLVLTKELVLVHYARPEVRCG